MGQGASNADSSGGHGAPSDDDGGDLASSWVLWVCVGAVFALVVGLAAGSWFHRKRRDDVVVLVPTAVHSPSDRHSAVATSERHRVSSSDLFQTPPRSRPISPATQPCSIGSFASRGSWMREDDASVTTPTSSSRVRLMPTGALRSVSP